VHSKKDGSAFKLIVTIQVHLSNETKDLPIREGYLAERNKDIMSLPIAYLKDI
jgi:hypothetical protein